MGVRGNAMFAQRMCTPFCYSNYFRIARRKMSKQNKATKIIFYQGQDCIHIFPLLSRKIGIANQGKYANFWSQKAPSTGISRQKRRLYSPVQTEEKGDSIHIMSKQAEVKILKDLIGQPRATILKTYSKKSCEEGLCSG